jgi:hypothetical protein
MSLEIDAVLAAGSQTEKTPVGVLVPLMVIIGVARAFAPLPQTHPRSRSARRSFDDRQPMKRGTDMFRRSAFAGEPR